MMKAKLFGITKSDDNSKITIFFKSPKRFVYILEFKQVNDYSIHDSHINFGLDKHEILKNYHFKLYNVEYKSPKYNLKLSACSQKYYNVDGAFESFFQELQQNHSNYVSNQKIIDIYEFTFSNILKEIMNKKNYHIQPYDKINELLKVFKKEINYELYVE